MRPRFRRMRTHRLPRLGGAVEHDAADAPLREQLRQQVRVVGAVVVAQGHAMDACGSLPVSTAAKLLSPVAMRDEVCACAARGNLCPPETTTLEIPRDP